MPRGTLHNRGKRLTTNTSGLSAIRFESRANRAGQWCYPYDCVSWFDRTGRARRASFSVDKHGQDGALGRAISKRLSGGYAVPGLAECWTALQCFRRG